MRLISGRRGLTSISIGITLLLAGCAAPAVKSRYQGFQKNEQVRHDTEMERIQTDIENRLVNISSISIFNEVEHDVANCGKNAQCIMAAHEKFIKSLRLTYDEANFNKLFLLCHKSCKTPRQLEFLAALDHNSNLQKEIESRKGEELQKHQNIVQNLNTEFEREYALAQERDRQTALAFAAGLQAAGESMRQQAAYQQSMAYSDNSYYMPTQSYQTQTSRRYNSSSYGGAGLTYYSGDVSGTSQRIGPFTYYNLNSGLSGSSQDIGNFRYYNFNSGLSGTSQRIGSFSYHNFNSGTTGTTQSIGNFDYTNFSDGTHCTTQYIGSTAYTNCN